ncbi:SDR family NAD(P)-dependent oxidoreductase [Natronomonas sp. EA1]|uniref:SDR family NAD(P)-dependent oxidoreductase n=1 Tax=Natronomonas sp. EA1 TaxID=3421655 RepID=UPI003EB98713
MVTVIAGCGPTLGSAIARRFASAGHDLVLLARSSDTIEPLAADLDAHAHRVDITDADAVRETFASIRELGRIDTLVLNASAPGGGSLRGCSPADFERTWRVRTLGSFCCLQAAADDLAGGAVLFSGTNYASEGSADLVDWGSAAAATKGLARSVARDLEATVVYAEIARAVAPADSQFAEAVNADDVAERYLAWLDRTPGFYAETIA